MPTLKVVKPWGLMPVWGDSLGLASFGGYIHCVGQARQGIFGSSKHYIFDTSGETIADIDAPITANAEFAMSTLGGKLRVVAGTLDYDVDKFDPTVAGNTSASWSKDYNNYSGVLGNTLMATGIDGPDGKFYLFGGQGNNTYSRTTLFTSGNWEVLGTLPNSIKKISANAICVVGNEIILIGGATNQATADSDGLYAAAVNGEVWGYNVFTNTFRLIYTNRELFGSIWLDAAASSDYVYVARGFLSPTQAATFTPPTTTRSGNQGGIYYAAKSDLTSWTALTLTDGNYFRHETHRMAMVYHAGKVYTLGGYSDNSMWRIDE